MFSSFVNLAIDQKVTALDNLIDMKKLLIGLGVVVVLVAGGAFLLLSNLDA